MITLYLRFYFINKTKILEKEALVGLLEDIYH